MATEQQTTLLKISAAKKDELLDYEICRC